MSDKPKRAWFQIHLSTAIVLMFVAGGLMWANSTVAMRFRYERVYGFPFPAIYSHPMEIGDSIDSLHVQPAGIDWFCLAGNIFVGLYLLRLTAFLSEYIIRRRAARKP